MKNNNYKDYSKYQWIWKNNIVFKKIIKVFKLYPHNPIICKTSNYKICIRPPFTSTIGRSIFLSGIWEKDMTSVVMEKVQPGWNVLDVGADVGYYSLLFATKCGNEGLVASFEPDPEPWPILQDNINMFELSNISSYAVALSDHRGNGIMKKGGKGQLYPDKEGTEDNTSIVKIVKLDDFWPKLGWKHLDLVKIDVEGAELSVLLGMEKLLKKYHPHLLIEIHPKQLKEIFNSSALELVQFLTEKNSYQLTPVEKKTFEIPKDGNITVWCDWVGKNNI